MKVEAKQHVELHRKTNLRRDLLQKAVPGAAYVPYIGDGDIAAELYMDRAIYGADKDQARLDTAAGRLPGSTVVRGDCEGWPLAQLIDQDIPPFAVADFDAYGDPYKGFDAFWQQAPKADTLVVFFTDGLRLKMQQSNWVYELEPHKWHRVDTRNEARTRLNFWLPRYVRPWLEQLVAPWIVAEVKQYTRNHMLYFGAVLQAPQTAMAPSQEAEAPTHVPDQSDALHTRIRGGPRKFAGARLERFLNHLAGGLRRGEALKAVDISRETFAKRMREDELFHQLVQFAELEANEVIEGALFESGKAGNVQAQKYWLNNREPERWKEDTGPRIAVQQTVQTSEGMTLTDAARMVYQMGPDEFEVIRQEVRRKMLKKGEGEDEGQGADSK